MTSGTPSRSPVRRSASLLGRVLLFGVGVFLFLVAGTNLFLALNIPTRLIAAPDEQGFQLTYEKAFSWVPGRVGLRGLVVKGLDENVRWEVRVEKADLKVNLPALRRQHFRGTGLRGENVQVRVRNHASSELKDVMAQLKKERERSSGPTPWKIEIQDVKLADVGRVQVNEFVFQGESEIAGSFFLHPKQRLWVENASWNVRSGNWKRETIPGTQVHAERPIVDRFSAVSLVRIHPVDLRKVAGSEILPYFDVSSSLKGRVAEASLLSLFFPEYGTLSFQEGRGALKAKVQILRGAIQDGSLMSLRFDELRFRLLGLRTRSIADIAFQVNSGRLKLDFEARDVASHLATVGPEQLPIIDGGRLRLTGNSSQLALQNPFTDLQLGIHADQIQVRNLGQLIAHLTGEKAGHIPLHCHRSEVTVRADVRPPADSARVQVEWSSDALRYLSASASGPDLTTRTKLSARLHSDRFSRGEFRMADVKLGFSDLKFSRGEGGRSRFFSPPDWEARVALSQASIRFGEPFSFSGDFNARFSNLKVPVQFALEPSLWTSLGMTLFPFEKMAGSGRLEVQGNGILFRNLDFSSGTQRIAGHLQSGGDELRGRLYLRLLPVPLCYTLGGDDSGLDVVLSESRCLKQAE